MFFHLDLLFFPPLPLGRKRESEIKYRQKNWILCWKHWDARHGFKRCQPDSCRCSANSFFEVICGKNGIDKSRWKRCVYKNEKFSANLSCKHEESQSVLGFKLNRIPNFFGTLFMLIQNTEHRWHLRREPLTVGKCFHFTILSNRLCMDSKPTVKREYYNNVSVQTYQGDLYLWDFWIYET